MKRLIYALSAVLASAGAPSQAVEPVSLVRQTSGYTYYNRPGADLTEHNAALSSCYWGVRASGPSQLYAGNTGIVPDMIVHAMSSQIRMAGQENCMVVSGWRVVRLPDAEGTALAKLSKPDLAEVLTPWVGAVNPPGEIVRVWQNDAARTSTVTRR